jgi:hypothetical protein
MMDTDGLTLDHFTIAQKIVHNFDRRGQESGIRTRRTTRTTNIPFNLGTPGSALEVGSHAFFRLSLGGDVTWQRWSLAATVAGLVFDGAVTLMVSAGPTLATIVPLIPTPTTRDLALTPLLSLGEITEQTLGGDWTPTIFDPSTLFVSVIAIDGAIEVVSFTMQVQV